MVYQLRLPQPQSQEGLDRDLQDVYTAKAYNVHKYNVCSLLCKNDPMCFIMKNNL